MDFQSVVADFASLFDQTARILKLRFGEGSGVGESTLLPQVLRGREALSECYRYELDCLSPDTHLELKLLLGLPVEVSVLLADGGYRVLSGLVTEARQLGSDGGFAKYGLVIEPALAILRHRTNSRVFQDKSVPEIVGTILDEHIASNAGFAQSFQHRALLSKDYPQRSYCLQHGESDRAFIERLLREEGISYRFSFSEETDTRNDDSEQQAVPTHTLILFDDAYVLDAAAQEKIRFHRADGTEGEDTITQWSAARQIQSGASALASFDYKAVSLHRGDDSTQRNQGEGGDGLSSTLEHYDPQTLYYGGPDDMARYATLRQQARDQNTKGFTGQGTARALSAGTWFELADHPNHDQDGQEDRQFLVTELSFEARNNLPDLSSPVSGEGAAEGAPRSGGASTGVPLADGEGQTDASPVYTNTFQALRRGIPVVPEYTQAHSKPRSTGPQTATVVGPAGEEIYTDALGRIKIQFHWQRQRDGHADLNETSSTWVRVAYPSAGGNWGHQYIPRIGQEVLIDFIEGDIDRPIVAGVVHNGAQLPPTFSDAGSLPANKTLSGIKTKEYKGSQYNELLFDDTTGETRTKLSTEHGKTQLSLGYLIHPRTEGKGEPRGEGFELRTDEAGALRAANGLILSTDARHDATGKQLDRQEAQSQLDAAFELANTLSDTAVHQLANQAETGKDDTLTEQASQAGQKKNTGHQHHLREAVRAFEKGSNTDTTKPPSPTSGGGAGGEGNPGEGGQPLILLSAPAGIALATPNSMTLATGTNLDQVSQRDTNQTSGRRWIHNVGESISIFVAGSIAKIKETIKLIAAKGKVQIQAQSDEIELTADQHMKFTAVKGQILARASEHITLTSGGGYIRLQGGNIEVHCPGVVSFKASQYVLQGGASVHASIPEFPSLEPAKNWISLHLMDPETMAGIEQRPYSIHFNDGNVIRGKLNDEGRAIHRNVSESGVRKVIYEPRLPKKETLANPLEDLLG